jgi:CheY-specific phosphatase CheX
MEMADVVDARPDTLACEVVDGFLAMVMHCLRSTVGVDAVIAAIGDPSAPSKTIAVALDFSGDVRGPVTWVFPLPIALELVRRLMCDPDPSPDFAAAGATELANILTGRASEALEARGFRCAIGVPRIHVGELPQGVSVRMATADGPIDVVLSMSAVALGPAHPHVGVVM